VPEEVKLALGLICTLKIKNTGKEGNLDERKELD
jgi:hypothetical protein